MILYIKKFNFYYLTDKNMQNYFDITPIKAYVRSSQVLNEYSDLLTECEIIGICAYTWETLTALIKLNDGAVFSYIPFSSLTLKKTKAKTEDAIFHLTPQEAGFVNCPDCELAISYLKNLDIPLTYYSVFTKSWNLGRYILTVDFVRDNELLNLLVDEKTGNLLFIPFHKVKFVAGESLDIRVKQYKKQRDTYRVL